MEYKFKNKDYEISYDVLELSSRIVVYRKGALVLLAISYDMAEWKDDTELALKLIRKSCPRRWLRKVFNSETKLPVWKKLK